jgi:hypothetical protein
MVKILLITTHLLTLVQTLLPLIAVSRTSDTILVLTVSVLPIPQQNASLDSQ